MKIYSVISKTINIIRKGNNIHNAFPKICCAFSFMILSQASESNVLFTIQKEMNKCYK